MNKIFISLLLILLFSSSVFAGEKEELQAKLEAQNWKMELLKRDTMVQEFIKTLTEAQNLQKRLSDLEKKTEKDSGNDRN